VARLARHIIRAPQLRLPLRGWMDKTEAWFDASHCCRQWPPCSPVRANHCGQAGVRCSCCGSRGVEAEREFASRALVWLMAPAGDKAEADGSRPVLPACPWGSVWPRATPCPGCRAASVCHKFRQFKCCDLATQYFAIPPGSRHNACVLCTRSPRPRSLSTWALKQAQNVGLVAFSRLFHQAPCSERHRFRSASVPRPPCPIASLGRRCFETWRKAQSLATPYKPPYAALPTCWANGLGQVDGGRLKRWPSVRPRRHHQYTVPQIEYGLPSPATFSPCTGCIQYLSHCWSVAES